MLVSLGHLGFLLGRWGALDWCINNPHSNYKQNFLVDQTRACVNCQPARVLMSGFSISCTCARGISIRMIVLGFKLLNATSQLCSVKNYIIIIIIIHGPWGVTTHAFRRSVFRAPAMRRGNSLGIEAWILKIRALLNPRLEAQCG